jgi:hypothetical protein
MGTSTDTYDIAFQKEAQFGDGIIPTSLLLYQRLLRAILWVKVVGKQQEV